VARSPGETLTRVDAAVAEAKQALEGNDIQCDQVGDGEAGVESRRWASHLRGTQAEQSGGRRRRSGQRRRQRVDAEVVDDEQETK